MFISRAFVVLAAIAVGMASVAPARRDAASAKVCVTALNGLIGDLQTQINQIDGSKATFQQLINLNTASSKVVAKTQECTGDFDTKFTDDQCSDLYNSVLNKLPPAVTGATSALNNKEQAITAQVGGQIGVCSNTKAQSDSGKNLCVAVVNACSNIKDLVDGDCSKIQGAFAGVKTKYGCT